MMSNNHHHQKSEKKMSSPPPPFSGTILEQVLQFLLPEDVARASMVCKAWQDDLKPTPTPTPPASVSAAAATLEEDEKVQQPGSTGTGIGLLNVHNKAVWKQAVTNSNPGVIQAVIQSAMSSSSSSDSGTSDKEAAAAAAAAQIDFHAIAKGGFGRKRKKQHLPEPTFRIEDLLIVLELKLERVVVKDENNGGADDKTSIESLGTFFVNGSEKMLEKNKCGNVEFDVSTGPNVVREGENPLCPETYNGDMVAFVKAKTRFHADLSRVVTYFPSHSLWSSMNLPFDSVSAKMLGKVKASVTLFRRDDWRSFCLLEDITIDRIFCDTPDRHQYIVHPKPWGHSGQSPFARNEAGIVARDVLASHDEIASMLAGVNMGFECVFPPPGSVAEPSWLKKCRMTRAAHMGWNEQDDKEISQVKSFQLRLGSISLSLGVHDDEPDDDEPENWIDYKDPKEFLLLLEGLDWQ